jgi:quercetin dioxygenase-like cupin family protein
MRKLLLLTTVLLAAASTAMAQPAIPPVADDSVIVIRNAERTRLVVFAWERNGEWINAWPGDGREIPYDAARNQVKLFIFPTGSIRELIFEKGSRTHPHPNKEDIFTYGVSGRRVQFVNEQSFQNEPGDAAFHPVGVSHHGETLRTGIAMEFAFPGKLRPNPEAVWISGRTPARVAVAEWVDGGRLQRAWDGAAAKAPAGAVKYEAKRYDFALAPLEEVHLAKGVKTPTGTRERDLISYVLKGRVRVTVAGKSDVAVPGDAIRQAGGRPFSREALEDSVLVEVMAPPSP